MRNCERIIKRTGFVALLAFWVFLPGSALGDRQAVADATKFFTSHGEPVAAKQAGRQLLLANRQVGVEIVQNSKGFCLSRIYGIASGQDFVSTDSASRGTKLWQLEMRRDQGRDRKGITITSLDGGALSSSIDRKGDQATLHLWWKGLAVAGRPDAVDVEVTVTVKQGDPLSRWRINVTNRSKVYGLWEVMFPVVNLVPIGQGSQTNYYTIGKSRGIVVNDPFNARKGFGIGLDSGKQWPGSLNMQFQSLYDDNGVGIYLAPHDGQGYRKKIYVDQIFDKQILIYKIGHLPANMGYPAEDYRITYDVCIGPFKGDWYDACQLYRSWALQQQWCQDGPLRTRKNMPKWYKETPLVLKTQSPQGDAEVKAMQDRILAVLDFIGMKMPIDWYGWQQFFPEKCSGQREGSKDKVPDARPYPGSNVHDGVYPALPALDAFSSACQTLFEAGGYVKPFVPARIFDPGLNENGPFAAQAKPNVLQRRVTDVGKIRWAYNKAYWLMCYNTPWWQQRLKEQAVTLLDKEKAHGMYFDTFYGGRPQCFSTKHGHSHGGGNDSYLAAVKHSQAVWGGMKQADPESVGTGEKCAETAINLLDGLLLNWPVWPEMAPLWAAVYGDYSRWSGNFLAPESDGYYIQATALFTEGGQMGRLRFQSNYDDWMKDFDAGSPYTEKMKFLRKLCHYWKPQAGGRFLAYGHLMRPLPLAQCESMPTFSYNETSRYVSYYKKGLITVPALMNGVFKTHDGDLGVFVVNVIDKPVEYNFELTADKYPISKSADYNVTPIDETGLRGKTTVQTGKITYSGKIAGRDVLFLEIKEQKAR